MSDRPPLEHYLALEYHYIVVPDDGSFFIKFPDLPGCITQVEDPAEIAAMAEEIRTLWIEGEYEDGHDIPEPSYFSGYSGKFVVRLPKRLHRDLAESAERDGVSLNAYVMSLLAERNLAAQIDARLDRIERSLAGQVPDREDASARPLAKAG
jgi:predicted RNase H-like HicB family nuclease